MAGRSIKVFIALGSSGPMHQYHQNWLVGLLASHFCRSFCLAVGTR
eukprot:COSAG02_NODE_1320_length_13269_cov_11.420058_8_plen_46_part_00